MEFAESSPTRFVMIIDWNRQQMGVLAESWGLEKFAGTYGTPVTVPVAKLS